ncbi:helix-turn-helix domain-containing protein [Alkalihalobacterium elongatum]|uniref:helix-turn-helix domain-containing protein n=1 Tax=Alkalihalobacterium elongatum TaxID=2675466 RepID=UPI001C1FA69F|nr:helix-turn-helix transcriptional regulator [Alkalihalobacterium elongatum]
MNTFTGKSFGENLREITERGRQHRQHNEDTNDELTLNIKIDINKLKTINDLLIIQNNGQSYIKRLLKKEETLDGFIHEALNREIERISIYYALHSASNTLTLREPKSEIKNRFKILMEHLHIKQTELSVLTGIPVNELSTVLNNQCPISMQHFLLIWDALNRPPLEECFN